MLKTLAICLALVSSISLINASTQDEWWTNGKSLLLNGGDYEDYIGKGKPIVVNFFSRFSAESKRTADEWEKVVEKYMNEGNNVIVAMIDGWNYESITEIYGIDILPTITFFAQGSTTPVRFEGEITAENMIAFVEKMMSSDVDDAVIITNDSDLEIMVQVDANNLNDEKVAGGEDAIIVSDDSEVEIMVQIDANTIEAATNEDVIIVPDNQELEIMVQIDASNLDNADAAEQMLIKIENEINVDINEHIDMTPPEATAEPIQEEMDHEVVENNQVVEEQSETQQIQEDLRKEVKVVLNTTLLQSQFQEVQDKADDVRTNIEAALNDNSQKIEQLKEFINTQKNDMKDLYEEIELITKVVEEITEKLFLENEEEERSSILPASRHLEEVKNAINEVKDKMFEELMGGGERSTPRSIMFLIGALGGAAITYIVVSLKNKKAKRLYD